MSLGTNLKGRLRNTSLKKTHALHPVFEAVINAIHACEERPDIALNDGVITVHVLREAKQAEETELIDGKIVKKSGQDALPNITGFKVVDNGVGFNDTNMKSFETLDSDYKEEKGGRGIGRLLWLKAFDSIEVSSIYNVDGKLYKRVFGFDKERAIFPINPQGKVLASHANLQTMINLTGFYSGYRNCAPKKSDTIAQNLLEHCLWYFIREGGRPTITVNDSNMIIKLDELFDNYTFGSVDGDSMTLGGHIFELTFIKARNTSANMHSIYYCADNRLVKKIEITNKIPGLYKNISDEHGQFSYLCFVASKFLDETVRSERTEFDIDEIRLHNKDDDQGNLLNIADDNKQEIVFDDINKAVFKKISEKLDTFLTKNKDNGRKRVENFVSTTAPKYKSIANMYPDLSVDPDTSDKELDIILYKHKSALESDLISKGHDLYTSEDDEPFEDYNKKLYDYLSTANAIKMSDLANYVSHRKVILDFFEQVIGRYRDGKYSREDVIHQLIMPMRVDSDEINFDDANLWLFDERLAFYNYLSSDKTLRSTPVTGSDETSEPDIFGINIYDNPLLVNEGQNLPLASITVIEIKRPMRNNFSEGEKDNPIEQALQYVEKIRAGDILTKNGRPIPESKSTPAFCYILADMTPTMISRAKNASLSVTNDYMGYFGFNQNYNAYIEVIGFDRLISAAKERNRAFFDKLGLPST